MALPLALIATAISGACAGNWALLVAGSKDYENYRHQADLLHMYHILKSKGFKTSQIITMAYDDIAHNEENPFPGKIFNAPSEGEGDDVYAGVPLDYTGDAVSVENFSCVMMGNCTGKGRVLDTKPDDDVFVFYVDHGAPGILEFPNGDVMHAEETQELLQTMHAQKRFGRLVFYIEACESGSILEGLPTNMSVYGVSAVGPTNPSLGTYCGLDAVVNGTEMNTCLGDLFSVYFMNYIDAGNGTHTMDQLFESVYDDVSSYASLHYEVQKSRRFGAIGAFKNFTLNQFFYPDPVSTRRFPFVKPVNVYSPQRMEVERLMVKYTEVSALPLNHGYPHWAKMRRATNQLQAQLQLQENIQNAFWQLVKIAKGDVQQQERTWKEKSKPKQKICEKRGHFALVEACGKKADMTSAYAMQFHQVLVNLCNDPSLSWGTHPARAKEAAEEACSRIGDDKGNLQLVIV